MPALGTRPHICGGSTRRGRAPSEDPPHGSRGSLEPATSLMIGGVALGTERARGARETGLWGPTVGAEERLRAVETWWATQEGMLPGPKREVGRPKIYSVVFLFYFFFPFHDLFFLSI
jgi:hypothetical protein